MNSKAHIGDKARARRRSSPFATVVAIVIVATATGFVSAEDSIVHRVLEPSRGGAWSYDPWELARENPQWFTSLCDSRNGLAPYQIVVDGNVIHALPEVLWETRATKAVLSAPCYNALKNGAVQVAYTIDAPSARDAFRDTIEIDGAYELEVLVVTAKTAIDAAATVFAFPMAFAIFGAGAIDALDDLDPEGVRFRREVRDLRALTAVGGRVEYAEQVHEGGLYRALFYRVRLGSEDVSFVLYASRIRADIEEPGAAR